MPTEPPAGSVPPIEPVPVTPPAVPVTPPPPPVPPTVDPYAASTPPPPAYGAPAYAPAYQAGYYGAPQPPKGLAIASMVTGIVSIVFSVYGFGILPSIAAIITGNLARKRQPYARGFWLAGLICGYIGLGLAILWIAGIIIFIVFFAANASTLDSGDYSTY
ncbi:MAG: hypothetical protein QOH69_1712 [Actinomycetota bacterium]|jgi:hypothetical protein|nr:hypothetical protein [Actinomycetota bacterium]